MIRQKRRAHTNRTGHRAQPPSNVEIQKWVVRHHGFIPETDWIIHCKQLFGLDSAIGFRSDERYTPAPCPPELQPAIKQAFQHFGVIP